MLNSGNSIDLEVLSSLKDLAFDKDTCCILEVDVFEERIPCLFRLWAAVEH